MSVLCMCYKVYTTLYTQYKPALVFNNMTYTPLLIVSEEVDAAVCGADNLAFRMKGSALS